MKRSKETHKGLKTDAVFSFLSIRDADGSLKREANFIQKTQIGMVCNIVFWWYITKIAISNF